MSSDWSVLRGRANLDFRWVTQLTFFLQKKEKIVFTQKQVCSSKSFDLISDRARKLLTDLGLLQTRASLILKKGPYAAFLCVFHPFSMCTSFFDVTIIYRSHSSCVSFFLHEKKRLLEFLEKKSNFCQSRSIFRESRDIWVLLQDVRYSLKSQIWAI